MKIPAQKQTSILLACLACCWFSSILSFAQDNTLKFERFGTENGLSSNVVYCIIQDSKGFLWIGTHDGLNRYDGYQFKIFRNNPSDSNSIITNRINSICEDSEGNIWVGTISGLCRYNYSKNNFTRIQLSKSGLVNDITQVVVVNKNELMVCCEGNKLHLLNIHTLQTKNLAEDGHKDLFRYSIFNPLQKDKQGKIYIACADRDKELWSVYVYDENEKKFKSYIGLPFVNKIKHGDRSSVISNFMIDSHNFWWISIANINKHLFHFLNAGGAKFSNESPVEMNLMEIHTLFEDKEASIWISTMTGLFNYNYQTGKFSDYSLNAFKKTPGKDGVITVFEDRLGTIWVGGFNGLYKLNPALKKFRHFTANSNIDPHLVNNFILGLYPSSLHKLWVSYYWGVTKFSLLDPETNSIRHFSTTEYNSDYTTNVITKNSYHIHEDSLRRWLSFIRKYLPLKNQFGLSFTNQYFLREVLWSGIKDPDIFRSENINDVVCNGDDYWIATNEKGLLQFRQSADSIIHSFTNHPGKNSISSDNLNCLLLEKSGNMWIGTNGSGLNYFDRAKNIFHQYTTEDGLCHNSIYNMVWDDHGRLWLGTGSGLSCLDTATKKFKNFFVSDGLVNSEFNRYSACRLSNGYLAMGGMAGIDYFHPDSILVSVIKPQVQITDFKVFNKDIPVVSNLSLPYDKNYISISFAAMDFRNPSANKFAYKLEGIDKDWIIANQNSVSYATLSPGHYHFLVKGAGSDGTWTDTPAEIYFTIATPWWRSGWFISIIGFAVFSILYSFYRFRIYQLKKLFTVRTKISRDLHDEVGATLTSISFLSEVMKQQTGNGSSPAHETIEKIGEYSRDMIGEMNDIVWAINPANDKFEKIEDRMQNFASTLLAAKNIQLNFKSDHEIKNLSLGMQQRKNLYLIFKEAINNAAKYACCTEVQVKVLREDHHIHLDIIDNGKGFSIGNGANGNHGSGGNGLKNMRYRAAEIDAKILIDSSPGRGTCISLSMPITQNAY